MPPPCCDGAIVCSWDKGQGRFPPITALLPSITAHGRALFPPITVLYYRLLPLSGLETEQMSAVEIGLMSRDSLQTRRFPTTPATPDAEGGHAAGGSWGG